MCAHIHLTVCILGTEKHKIRLCVLSLELHKFGLVPGLLEGRPNHCLNSVLYFQIPAGHVVKQLVEALRYKPEGHGFDS